VCVCIYICMYVCMYVRDWMGDRRVTGSSCVCVCVCVEHGKFCVVIYRKKFYGCNVSFLLSSFITSAT
jgi:hypothetical protein